jgi:ribonuclease P protein component
VLRRNKRIQGRTRVAEIIKQDESKKTRHFVLKSMPNDLGYARYAIVISKKLERLAVKRNKRRRQVYEVLGKRDQGVAKKASSDIVLLLRRPTMKLNFDELSRALHETLS